MNCHDEDEAPLEGALVRLSRDGSVFREQPTNAEGQAFFKQLVAGQYRVDGEKQGFRGQHRDIEVVAGGVSDQNVSAKNSFAQDADPASGGGGNPPVNLQLDKELAVIHVVAEKPANISTNVAESAENKFHKGKWQRLEGNLASGAGDEPLRFDVNGKAFPFIESPPAKLTNLGVLKPHVWPVKYRIWNEDGSQVLQDPPVEPGTTLKVQISTRLRLSILHFFPPFISITAANTLDSDLLALLGKAPLQVPRRTP